MEMAANFIKVIEQISRLRDRIDGQDARIKLLETRSGR
jgi:hypothetical protein